jgi:hypothetical protein
MLIWRYSTVNTNSFLLGQMSETYPLLVVDYSQVKKTQIRLAWEQKGILLPMSVSSHNWCT